MLILNPYRYAAAAGTTLFLDETGLGSAAAAYSTSRKLRSAYAGSCLRVRRSSDSTEQDIGFVSDALDTASLTTFCSATDGFVVKIYDQSGNARDLTQSTAANQPQIVASGTIYTGANSKPECRTDGANDYLQTASFTLTQPTTVFNVFNPITWTNNDTIYDGLTNVSMLLTQSTTTPNVGIYAGTLSALKSFTLATHHLATAVFSGAASTLRKNADAETTSSIGTASPSGLSLAARGGIAFYGNIGFQEMVVYASAKSSGDQTTARSNVNAFYALY
jgi:hypothetical protein